MHGDIRSLLLAGFRGKRVQDGDPGCFRTWTLVQNSRRSEARPFLFAFLFYFLQNIFHVLRFSSLLLFVDTVQAVEGAERR